MRGRSKLAFLCASVIALPSFQAFAAEDDEPHREIVVTGERVGRSVLETTSSVVVLDSSDLETLSGADRIDQVWDGIPNLQTGSGGEGPTFRGQDTTGVLRDLPAFLGGTRPRMTLQVDGRPTSYNELAFGVSGLWDLDRVEVFRSPQTTTQGRNSIAGAVFVETKEPSLDWEGRVRLIGGNYATRQVSGLVSGPIASDQLAFRLTGDVRSSRTTSKITSAARGIDANRDVYDMLRLKLLATPSILPGLRLTASYAHTTSQSPQIEGLRQPYRERRDPAGSYGIFSLGVDALTLRASYAVTRHLEVKATGWLGWATIRRFAPPGFGEANNKGSDSGAELILSWAPSDELNIVGGVATLGNKLDQTIDLTSAQLGTAEFQDAQDSFGAFGQIDARPGRWDLGAGLRYQHDGQKRVGLLNFRGARVPFVFEKTYARLLPKGSISYAPSPAIKVGLSVQRAYNPGGTTINLNTFAPDTFDAETLWAYEGFARAGLQGGRLQISANVFDYDIRNAQRSIINTLNTPGGIVTFAEIGNARAAWSRGAELQADWRPSRVLSMTAGLGIQRTRLTRTLSASDPLLGKEFQRAPHFTASVRIDWRPLRAVHVSGQMRHNSGYFSDDANDPLRRIGQGTNVDVRAEWSRGSLSIAAYVRNALNRFHLTYLFAPSTGLATANGPRKVGLEATLSF